MRFRITALFCFMMLTIIFCFSLDAYAASGITVSSPHFYTQAGTELFKLETGTVKGELALNNQTGNVQKAVLLLVLYNKKTGEMEGIEVKSYDNMGAGKTTLSNTINVASAADKVIRAYVWSNADGDSVSLSRSYELFDIDEAPSSPTGIYTANATYHTLDIAWDEAYDNLNAVSYEVYRDGNLVGTPDTTAFKDSLLDYGKTYKYTIKAKDASGNLSDFSQEYSASTADAAYCIFGTNNVTHLLDKPIQTTPNFDGGYYSEVAVMGPDNDKRECRKIEFIKPYNGNNNGAANYLTIGIDSAYISNSDRQVTVKLTYLDRGTDTVAIEYTSINGSGTVTTYTKLSAAKENSGNWVTHTFYITDAYFDNRQGPSGQYDMRIQVGESNTAEYINKIEVFKGTDI